MHTKAYIRIKFGNYSLDRSILIKYVASLDAFMHEMKESG